MNHHQDFKELLSALSAERADFLIVGAYAVMKYSQPRFTKDLDIWIGASPANAKKVYRALQRFGAPLKNIRVEDLATPGVVFQIGIEPVRIDILTQVDGLDFDDAWKRRVAGTYGSVRVAFLSVNDLIANKRVVGRPQDLLDIEKLQAPARGTLHPRPTRKKPRKTTRRSGK